MHLCLDPFLNRLYLSTDIYGAFQVALVVKSPSANADLRHRYNSWVRKIPWRRKWQLTPVFLPEKSHEQRNLEGYSPWAAKSQVLLE